MLYGIVRRLLYPVGTTYGLFGAPKEFVPHKLHEIGFHMWVADQGLNIAPDTHPCTKLEPDNKCVVIIRMNVLLPSAGMLLPPHICMQCTCVKKDLFLPYLLRLQPCFFVCVDYKVPFRICPFDFLLRLRLTKKSCCYLLKLEFAAPTTKYDARKKYANVQQERALEGSLETAGRQAFTLGMGCKAHFLWATVGGGSTEKVKVNSTVDLTQRKSEQEQRS